MKNFDISEGQADKDAIETKTRASLELVIDSAINAIDTLTDVDIEGIFECLLGME